MFVHYSLFSRCASSLIRRWRPVWPFVFRSWCPVNFRWRAPSLSLAQWCPIPRRLNNATRKWLWASYCPSRFLYLGLTVVEKASRLRHILWVFRPRLPIAKASRSTGCVCVASFQPLMAICLMQKYVKKLFICFGYGGCGGSYGCGYWFFYYW